MENHHHLKRIPSKSKPILGLLNLHLFYALKWPSNENKRPTFHRYELVLQINLFLFRICLYSQGALLHLFIHLPSSPWSPIPHTHPPTLTVHRLTRGKYVKFPPWTVECSFSSYFSLDWEIFIKCIYKKMFIYIPGTDRKRFLQLQLAGHVAVGLVGRMDQTHRNWIWKSELEISALQRTILLHQKATPTLPWIVDDRPDAQFSVTQCVSL